LGLDRRLFGRILAITAGKHETHYGFVYGTFFDAGSFDGFLDNNRSQLRCTNVAQRTVETAQGRSDRTDDDCLSHRMSLLSEFKITKPKHQISNKLQIRISNDQNKVVKRFVDLSQYYCQQVWNFEFLSL
jgi:hypothetical protein